MTRAILDGLDFLGIDVDEGPVFQSGGVERHRADAAALLVSGAAYRCFCSPEALARRREAAARTGTGYGYDGRCRHLEPGEVASRVAAGTPFALRMRVPPGSTRWEDLIHGPMSFANETIDDFIVLRSDGSPVYNLAVVSDDVEAGITHVVRGDDHISNTPKQILIYEALGHTTPNFGHVPLIVGPDGKRLSKRHGAMSVLAYREMGFLPAGMVNFLALLGWSPGDDREVLGIDELIEAFSIERILKKSAVFDIEKLRWLNGRHIAATPSEELARLVETELIEASETDPVRQRERLARVIDLVKVRPRTVTELLAQAAPFFASTVEFDPPAVDRFWKRADEAAAHLRALASVLDALPPPWTPETVEPVIRDLAERREVGAGQIINPLRLALMGQGVSPGIFEVVALMGPDLVRARIDCALGYLDAKASTA